MEQYLFPEIVCGGVALFDMEGDGDLDCYLVQAGSYTSPREERAPNQLFRNRGDGTFEDVTAGSGADDRGYGMGVTAGDYDNDGDIDLYVTNVDRNTLLQNQGDGTFVDVTNEAGAGVEEWSTSVAFVDYDRDGDLDLFMTNYVYWSRGSERNCYAPSGILDYCHPNNYEAPARDTLLRNNGDGSFEDVSEPAGIHTAFGNGLGVVCTDFNDDGWVDIFVANDSLPNQLWVNQQDGTFVDEAFFAGCAIDEHGMTKAGMGVAVGDVDHDLDPDLLVVNLRQQSDSFFRNVGGHFVDDTASIGLGVVSQPFTRFGVAFFDYDNDGWLDLYQANGRVAFAPTTWIDDRFAEPNLLLRGSAAGILTEAQPRGGTADLLLHTSRAAAFGDIDNDGGVDIVVVNRDGPTYLLHNVAASRGHWIMLRVIDEHGRDAIGATVVIHTADRAYRRDVLSAYSYCAAGDPRVHVGLGVCEQIDRIEITWPDGVRESFTGVPIDGITTLRRNDGAPINEAGDER